MKKYLSLFLCFIAVIALVITGCGGTHGYGSDAADGPLNIKEWEVKDGKVTAELGGFKFSFDESNMKDGIFVTLKQLEATDTSTEPELVGSSYIYDLKAILKKSGTLESDVTVKTLEKAADITIHNDIPGYDRYLLGMRNEGDNDWSYSLINDDNETNPLFVTSARFSSALALTVSKGTGIATVSEGGSYKADTEITLEYTLETGYEFYSWVSSEVTVDENNKFIMPS